MSAGIAGRAARWARANLFSSPLNATLTVLSLGVLAWVVPPLLEWAVARAHWQPDPSACRAAEGACWGLIAEKFRLILFGTYPYGEQWRPLIAMILFLALVLVTLDRRMWTWRRLVPMWTLGVAAVSMLMWGGVFGLTYVENTRWGGLPLTLILAVVGMVGAFPLAIALALGRQSTRLPLVRALCVGFIELIRGVPLISVLFMASVMFPLFLPPEVTIDKLLRAQVGIILFTAAYLAETVRGGLQALPRGQFEAADALGLSYWQRTRHVVLPQALRTVIPPIVGTYISMFKDTSLVLIIGLFDLLGAAKAALNDPEWRAFAVEGYVFIGLVYFVFCYGMAWYSRKLERDLGVEEPQ